MNLSDGSPRPLLNRGSQVRPSNEFKLFSREELEQSIAERFERQVGLYPNRIALKTAGRTLTYSELDSLTNRIAQKILSQYESERGPIAIMVENDALAIATVMGVLKTGKIYVPLDHELPKPRLRAILQDSAASVIVTCNNDLSIAGDLICCNDKIINVNDLRKDGSDQSPRVNTVPTDPAHIVYTSGSTGISKGVIENHRNILHHVMRVTNTAHYCEEDRMTLLRSPLSGGALMNVFSALLNGASLFPFDIKKEGVDQLIRFLIEEEITVYHSSVSLFRRFIRSLVGSEQFPHLRLIRLGSEPVLKNDVESYRRHFPATSILVNALNCTEANTFRQNFFDKNSEIIGDVVPVGYPAEDMEVFILDESGKKLGPGEIGEIVIRSRFLSPGYWRKPELTRAAFLADKQNDTRIFCTGDLGRMLEDGCLEHLGRKDYQVKIRGHKVQTNEVESLLLGIAGIEQAAVAASEDRDGSKRLVAYLVFASGQHVTITQVRTALQERLPSYMLPANFVVLDTLPITSSGKVDRRALPPPKSSRPEFDQAFVAPRTPVEVVVARIWSEILEVDTVGVHDRFLDLGGDSLLSSSILSRVNRIFSLDLTPRVLLQADTVAKLSEIMNSIESDRERTDSIARTWLTIGSPSIESMEARRGKDNAG